MRRSWPLVLVWLTVSCRTLGSVSISQPKANQSLAGRVKFVARARADIASVEFGIGSLKIGTSSDAPFSVTWNTGYQGDGTYYVRAIGRDSAGKKIAVSAPQAYTVNNHGISVNVTGPDLSKPVSRTMALAYTEADPTHTPYLAQIFIDGTNVANGWTDNSTLHTQNLTAAIDTTVFANGPHELNLTMVSADTTKKMYYAGGYNRVIDIENGHAFMDVAANYLQVYLQPNGTTRLSCRDLFTDATSAACVSPTYSSSDATHVVVDASGNVTAAKNEGFAVITISDKGKSTKTYVTVRTSPSIPHFAHNGQFLNRYTPGKSLFVVSLVHASPGDIRKDPSWDAGFKAAGINTLEYGIYFNPRNTTQDLASWESSYDGNYTSSFNWAAQNGYSLLLTGDDITRDKCGDAWWTLTWPSARDAVQYAFSQTAKTGAVIGVEMMDEANGIWGNNPDPAADWTAPCGTIPKTWMRTLRSWITSVTPTVNITWPNGNAPVAAWGNWDGPGGVADFVTQSYDTFQDERTYIWSSGVLEKNYWMWKVFYDRQPFMMLDRPQLQPLSTSGTWYEKKSAGAFYNPPADLIIQPGDIGPVVSSGIMSAAALGEAGVRLYRFQTSYDTALRATYANGVALQTGVNPIDTDREISANWRAISNASNAIKTLTPYLLAQPLNSPAYGKNILTAARQGADGRMLLIVNDNDFERTIPVDFTRFAYSRGAITKYLIGADLLTSQVLIRSTPADTVTLDGGESVAYVFAP